MTALSPDPIHPGSTSRPRPAMQHRRTDGPFIASAPMRWFRIGIACITAAGAMQADVTPKPDWAGLLEHSPFGGESRGNQGVPTAPPLEFRGVVMEGSVYFFSLFDSATQRSVWVQLMEQGPSFTVLAYDEHKELATVNHHGRLLSLPLKLARVVENPMGREQVEGDNPQDAARLASLAAEIRRRRAQRTAALQAMPTKETEDPAGTGN